MKILHISLQYAPNIGGLETHLTDLMEILTKRGFEIFVLSYQPLTTKTQWKIYEKTDRVEILRIPWFTNLYYKLIPFPKLQFLYLFPGLFLTLPILLTIKKPDIIHAHGLIAGLAAVTWGRLFKVRSVISTHSIYSIPRSGLYRNIAKFVFMSTEYVLCVSRKSLKEIYSLGIGKDKIEQFTYWVDLKRFKKRSDAKVRLGWNSSFVVLFVGRLISEKGIRVLLKSVKKWDRRINLFFIGSGPLEKDILKVANTIPSVKFIGKIDQSYLPLYYSAADCLIVPSIYKEGFGRVIIESLACATPVIASNQGSIPEVMNERVGKLINVTAENIQKTIEYFLQNPLKLRNLSKNARSFVSKRYSEANVDKIIKAYKSK